MANSTSKDAITKEEVNDFLKKWVGAYESHSSAFFDFFASDATVFTVSSPVRIDGLDEFKRGFEESFGKQSRKSQILTPEIRLMGNAAMVSYHNRVKVDRDIIHMRATVVLEKSDKGVKIVHLHNSPLTTVGAGAVSGAAPQAVTLLEERVATAIGAVGTPR